MASSATASVAAPTMPRHQQRQLSLVPSSLRHRRRRRRVLRFFHSICRAPLFTPTCNLLASRLLTGTLFGYRNGRASLSLQRSPECLPFLVIDLAVPTVALLREMRAGMVRIALECERRPPEHGLDRPPHALLDEQVWTMFCKGRKIGHSVRREATEEDLAVMETLKAVSMGAGVLPGRSATEGPEGEMTYVRAGFEHVVGSRDSETLYMTCPNDDDGGSDLTIFFVRL